MKQNNKRILSAQIVIVIVIILAVLLPQLIGTAMISTPKGTWKSNKDLAGKVIGVLADSGLESVAWETIRDPDVRTADDLDELTALIKDDTADAILVSNEDMWKILPDTPELTPMMDRTGSYTFNKANATLLVAKEDYAYYMSKEKLSSLDYPGMRIAGLTGSELSELPPTIFPQCEVSNYNNFTDMFIALESGKVDAVAAYDTQVDMVNENYGDITFLAEPLTKVSYGFGTRHDEKGNKLKAEFNTFLKELSSSGKLEELDNKWQSVEEGEDASLTYEFPEGSEVLHVETSGVWFPMSYYSGKNLTGKFVELIDLFCLENGYQPEFECVDYPTGVAGLSSGTYDIMADTLFITPERLERINITDPVQVSFISVATKSQPETYTVPKAQQFITSITNGFYTNFIRENRWQMVLDGLMTTLILSVLTFMIGTILGAAICALRMSKYSYLTAFARLYVRFFQGIPLLVLLMVLYYIIFNNTSVAALWVCVIGFSLDFAAYSSEIFRNGIEAVPAGQARAAKALGFTKTQGFIKVVFPQAMRHILPVFSGQLVSMVKMTSIAGYISVMDLTKVTDIIRSRTYDAFFPLLAAAVIYFLLSYLLIGTMQIIRYIVTNPDRKRVLRGVDTTKKASAAVNAAPAFEAGKELLVIEHLAKSFGDVTPIQDLSTVIRAGDVISVIGPSGTGKSTLLNLINHLEKPDDGKIIFEGTNTLTKHYNFSLLRRKVGMVFQSFNLFAHLTIVENVMLAQVELLGRSRQEAYERSVELLESVGLASKVLSYPAELSGGQQQRVAIARAIAMDPQIMLFDEPTSALDPTMVGEVLSVIRNLAQKGTTMLIVTHEMKFAHDVSNRVFYMDEGGIYEDGSPKQIFEDPQKEKTRIFIKRLKQLEFEINEGSEDPSRYLKLLQKFCTDNMIGSRMQRDIELAFEEFVQQGIMQRTDAFQRIPIRLEFEYSETENSTMMTLTYGGNKYDPFTQGDAISAKIVQTLAAEVDYVYDTENRVTVRFRD